MDKLQPLHLFTDAPWQQCLESFLDDLARRESHTTVVDRRTTLKSFFTPDRAPAAVLREEVEAFCRQTPSYHGGIWQGFLPGAAIWTAKISNPRENW